MKEYKEWPKYTVALLAKKILGPVPGQDYVDWAVQALTEGFDSPSLSILAGLDIDPHFSQWEVEKFFAKAVNELELVIPEDEIILRNHLITLVRQIYKGIVDPEVGVNRIHKEVVSPLGHPADLMPWCFLWEGNYPMGNAVIPEEEYSQEIIQFARAWWAEKLDGK